MQLVDCGFWKRMVGVDDQVIHEKSKEMNGVYDECLEPCAEANGNMVLHLNYMDTPTPVAGGVGNVKRSILCPITPTPSRENGELGYVTSTPLSMESPESPNPGDPNSPKNEEVVASVPNDSPRTPDEGVFDSFAPGPDAMLLAPICKKLLKESRRIISRRLNFDDINDFPACKEDKINADALSENFLLESFYGDLLEVIILKQSEEFLAENCSLESVGLLHTPTSPPPLVGVADTCPGAPVKAAGGKSINIDPGLCRKLEF